MSSGDNSEVVAPVRRTARARKFNPKFIGGDFDDGFVRLMGRIVNDPNFTVDKINGKENDAQNKDGFIDETNKNEDLCSVKDNETGKSIDLKSSTVILSRPLADDTKYHVKSKIADKVIRKIALEERKYTLHSNQDDHSKNNESNPKKRKMLTNDQNNEFKKYISDEVEIKLAQVFSAQPLALSNIQPNTAESTRIYSAPIKRSNENPNECTNEKKMKVVESSIHQAKNLTPKLIITGASQNRIDLSGKTQKLMKIVSIKFPANLQKNVVSQKNEPVQLKNIKIIKYPIISSKSDKPITNSCIVSSSVNWFSSDGEDDIPLNKLFEGGKSKAKIKKPKLKVKNSETVTKMKKNINKQTGKKVKKKLNGSNKDKVPLSLLLKFKDKSSKSVKKDNKAAKCIPDFKFEISQQNKVNKKLKKFHVSGKTKLDANLKTKKKKKFLVEKVFKQISSESDFNKINFEVSSKKKMKLKMKFAGSQKSNEKHLTNIVVSVDEKGDNYTCLAVEENMLTSKIKKEVPKLLISTVPTPRNDKKYTILKEGMLPGINQCLVLENVKDQFAIDKISLKKIMPNLPEKDQSKISTKLFHEEIITHSPKNIEISKPPTPNIKKNKPNVNCNEAVIVKENISNSCKNKNNVTINKLEHHFKEEDSNKNEKHPSDRTTFDSPYRKPQSTTKLGKPLKKEVAVFEDALSQPDLIVKVKMEEKSPKKERHHHSKSERESRKDKKSNCDSKDRSESIHEHLLKTERVQPMENSQNTVKDIRRQLSESSSPNIKQETKPSSNQELKCNFDSVICFNEKEYRKNKKEEKLKSKHKRDHNSLKEKSSLKEVKKESRPMKEEKLQSCYSSPKLEREKSDSKHKSHHKVKLEKDDYVKHRHHEKSKHSERHHRKEEKSQGHDNYSKHKSSSKSDGYSSSKSNLKLELVESSSKVKEESDLQDFSSFSMKATIKPEIIVDEVKLVNISFKSEENFAEVPTTSIKPVTIAASTINVKSVSDSKSDIHIVEESIFTSSSIITDIALKKESNAMSDLKVSNENDKVSIYELVDDRSDFETSTYEDLILNNVNSDAYEPVKPGSYQSTYSYEPSEYKEQIVLPVEEMLLSEKSENVFTTEVCLDKSTLNLKTELKDSDSSEDNKNDYSQSLASSHSKRKKTISRDTSTADLNMFKDGDSAVTSEELSDTKPSLPLDEISNKDLLIPNSPDSISCENVNNSLEVEKPSPIEMDLASIHLPGEDPIQLESIPKLNNVSQTLEMNNDPISEIEMDILQSSEEVLHISEMKDISIPEVKEDLLQIVTDISSMKSDTKIDLARLDEPMDCEQVFNSGDVSKEDDVKLPFVIEDEKPKKEHNLEEIEAKNRKIVERRMKSFKLLEENLYLMEKVNNKRSKEARRMVCDCALSKEELSNGDFGCGEDCLNKLLMIECGSRCPIKDRCMNRKFTNKSYADVEVFNAQQKGCGIRAKTNIESGTFLMEYIGEVFDSKEFKRRRKDYSKDSNAHFYFMALRSDRLIDATKKGNISRFINHSCSPNAETQKWTVNGDIRIGFFSTCLIIAGEEINFDYRLERYGREPQKCYCGTAECRGWLGESPDEKTKEEKEEDRRKELRDKKRREERRSIFEEDDVDDEIDKLNTLGLRNKEDTLNLSRLMVRATDCEARSRLLQLLSSAEATCHSLFLDYHGLTLLWSWMVDISSSNKYLSLKIQILQVMKNLPLNNKTQLIDSRVLSMVERWSKKATEETNASSNSEKKASEEANSPLDLIQGDSSLKKSSDSDSDSECKEAEGPSSSSTVSPDDSSLDSNETPKRDCVESTSSKVIPYDDTSVVASPTTTEDPSPSLLELTRELLCVWSNLKETFRIPKKERIQIMKEHERALDREYKAYLNNDDDRTQAFYDRFRFAVGDKDRKKDRKVRVSQSQKELSDSSGISKEERRERFAQQVAKEEEEAAKQKMMMEEENWNRHVEQCKIMGLDPLNIPLLDVTGQYYWDHTIGAWQLNMMTQSNLAVFTNDETAIEPMPMTIKLPRQWKMARDAEGYLYFYHTRTRFTQWDIPSQDQHRKLMTQFGLDSDSDSDSDFTSSSDSEVFSDNDEDEMDEKSKEISMKNDGGDEKMIKRNKGKRKRSAMLVQERVISPILVEDREAARRERKEAKERARVEARKERRTLKISPEQDSPNEQDEEKFEASLLKHTRKYHKAPKVKSKGRGNTAMADNSASAKKIKESFRSAMATYIVNVLKPFMKSDCQVGRISTTDDFKFLARKLTHHVMVKELRMLPSIEKLVCNDSVQSKTKEFVGKYMAKFGPTFVRDPNDKREY